MIDTLLRQVEAARKTTLVHDLGLLPRAYCVVTLHRPANVDDPSTLGSLLKVLERISQKLPIVFPVHPRTRLRMEQSGLLPRLSSQGAIRLLEPLGYNDFLSLTSQAKCVVSDSGGVQEEATALGIPCLTMRENTERPITVEEGTNTLCGTSAEKLEAHLREVLSETYKRGRCPALWDGRASERIVAELMTW
jgi:UDP-N-acetylglucosamine 2-epimerase (non-hydrolysing)